MASLFLTYLKHTRFEDCERQNICAQVLRCLSFQITKRKIDGRCVPLLMRAETTINTTRLCGVAAHGQLIDLIHAARRALRAADRICT